MHSVEGNHHQQIRYIPESSGSMLSMQGGTGVALTRTIRLDDTDPGGLSLVHRTPPSGGCGQYSSCILHHTSPHQGKLASVAIVVFP